MAGLKNPPAYLHLRLGDQVRTRRLEAGLTQEALAERTGLHRTYVGAIERGERNVSLATLEALARGLDCDPSNLVEP